MEQSNFNKRKHIFSSALQRIWMKLMLIRKKQAWISRLPECKGPAVSVQTSRLFKAALSCTFDSFQCSTTHNFDRDRRWGHCALLPRDHSGKASHCWVAPDVWLLLCLLQEAGTVPSVQLLFVYTEPVFTSALSIISLWRCTTIALDCGYHTVFNSLSVD